jgi:hypothetical protein
VYHYRTQRSEREVDLIVERDDQRFVAIEVKSATRCWTRSSSRPAHSRIAARTESASLPSACSASKFRTAGCTVGGQVHPGVGIPPARDDRTRWAIAAVPEPAACCPNRADEGETDVLFEAGRIEPGDADGDREGGPA